MKQIANLNFIVSRRAGQEFQTTPSVMYVTFIDGKELHILNNKLRSYILDQ